MISDVYFPRINGVSTSISSFKNKLEALGHRVILLAPDYGQAEQSNSSILRIPSRNLPLDPEDRAMRWKKIFSYSKSLAGMDIDIIHIHTPFIAHYAGLELAKKLNIPCVETYHTYFEEYLYHYIPVIPGAWMKSTARYFTRKQCNKLDAVIVPSSAMQKVLNGYGVSTPTEILPTGLELENFQKADGNSFRKKYNIPLDRPTLVFIGRVAHEKNIDFLLHVLKNVKKQVPNVLLLIAGEGPALSHLIKLSTELELKNNTLFLGYLDRNKELLDCYACADAFVFASNTETQGLVLLEAMALGVPLISTAVLGTKDILAAKKGALISDESVEDFSANTIRLLNDRLLRNQLSKEALEYVQSWSANEMTQKLISLYKKVIKSHSQA